MIMNNVVMLNMYNSSVVVVVHIRTKTEPTKIGQDERAWMCYNDSSSFEVWILCDAFLLFASCVRVIVYVSQ